MPVLLLYLKAQFIEPVKFGNRTKYNTFSKKTTMKTIYILLIFILLQVSSYYAQLKGGSYQFPERFSPNYFFDPNLSYQKIKDVQVKGFTPEQMDFYKIQKTYNTQRDFDNNSFYMEWNELENYLYKIIDTIIPQEIKIKQPLDVFIKRDIEYNASALGNGFVYANIGLLANCKSEAELAFILGHEIGHSIFNHGYMINADLVSAYNRNDISSTIANYYKMFEKEQYAELQSDSFGAKCLNKASYNLLAVKPFLSMISYNEFTSKFYVKEGDRLSYSNYMSKFGSHPSFSKRSKEFDKYISKKNIKGRNYIIDSVYFQKVKKIAHDECKKISFEEGDYENAMKLSFIDYLQGDNGLKNLFYLFESIRRYLYTHPEYGNKGFLAEDFQFTEFENTNYSILKKPEILFNDSIGYLKSSNHPLITEAQKPFNTYEEAYIYFVEMAIERKFNEGVFSKALYYFSKKDEIKFKFFNNLYLENGAGIYKSFAENLKTYGFPYITSGKTAILIDNSTNYSESDNYYHSLSRIKYSPAIKEIFKNDTSKAKITLMNDLLGIRPRELYNYQKLTWNITQLYNQNDEEIFYKLRYLKKESMEEREIKNKFNKNLMIFIPDWFTWFSDTNLKGILIQQIQYKYAYVTDENEYMNFYKIQYLNFFDNRPYFGKCMRTATFRKQTSVQMANEVKEYLWLVQ